MIYKYDIRYSIAKFFVDIAFRLNFRKLIITGKENIPEDVPMIFTPNHRNALMDALAVVFAGKHKRQTVFLARSDIFEKRFITWILYGLKIIPVYRIRDGKENLGKNGKIFEIAGSILRNNNPIALFPEAVHNPKQSLLPLQKAVPRIVLPLEASHSFTLNSKVIPVSIYYTDVMGFLSDCYVHFGEPISVADYKNYYIENPNLTVNRFRIDLETCLRNMIVDIRNEQHYDMYKSYIGWNSDEIALQSFSDEKDAVVRKAKQIVKYLDDLNEKNPEQYEQKVSDYEEAIEIIKKHKLNPTAEFRKQKTVPNLIFKYILLILTFPLALTGFVNAVFPILIYKQLLKHFKDKQFTASVRFVVGLFFIPLFDIMQALIVKALFQNWSVALYYFIAMPLTFLFAIHWRRIKKSVNRQWQVNRFKKFYPDLWSRLVNLISLK